MAMALQFANIHLNFAKTWMICSAVKEDDKVGRGPRVLIQVNQHLHHHLDHDIGDDANASVDGDGDGGGDLGRVYLSPVEDGRAGLHFRDWVLGVENVNDRHSALKFTKRTKNAKVFP